MSTLGSILIVDDEQFIRQILLRTVTRAGFVGEEASDGDEALARMADQPFDLVISDVQMPRMDGLQLLARIRETYPDTIVVLITGQKSLMPSGRGDHRADAIISKPFHNGEIVKKLQLLIQERRRKKARVARALAAVSRSDPAD